LLLVLWLLCANHCSLVFLENYIYSANCCAKSALTTEEERLLLVLWLLMCKLLLTDRSGRFIKVLMHAYKGNLATQHLSFRVSARPPENRKMCFLNWGPGPFTAFTKPINLCSSLYVRIQFAIKAPAHFTTL
jgi:hypothetical protein